MRTPHWLLLLLAYSSVVFGGFVVAIIGAIVTFIGDVFQVIGTTLKEVVLWIVNTALPKIIASILSLGSLVGRGFRFFVKAVTHVLSDIVHGRFVHLWEDYLRLKEKLRRFFEPVLRILRRIRQIFDQFFKQFIAPVLNLLQQIRGILVVFRIFHLKFAEALDRKIVQLEGKIIRNTLILRSRINELITLISIIADPQLLLRRNVLAASLLKYLGAVKRVIAFGHNRALTPEEEKQQKQEKELVRPGVAWATAQPSGTVVEHPAVAAINQKLDVSFGELTGQT